MAGSDGSTQVGRRRITSWLVLPLVLSFAGLPIACGGGDETSEEAITKAQFVARANRICVKAAEVVGQRQANVFRKRPPETDEVLTFFRELGPLIHKAVDEIDAIPAPTGDEQQVAAIVDAGSEDADRIEQAVTDPSVLRTLHVEGLYRNLFRAFRAYGVDECAREVNPLLTTEGKGG